MKCDLCGQEIMECKGTSDDNLCHECYCKVNDLNEPKYKQQLTSISMHFNQAKQKIICFSDLVSRVMQNKRNKNIAIGLILSLVFIFSFLIQVKPTYLGPLTTEQKDDIGINEAYYDKTNNELILITPDKWAKLSLGKISKTNKKYTWHIDPVSGNFLHWRSFKNGRPPTSTIKLLAPVLVAMGQFASFAYNGDKDGYPYHNFTQRAEIPAHYSSVLYRSDAEHDKTNINWYKGYILRTPFKNADNRYGVKFYYHPDVTYKVNLRNPLQLALFGFSYLALCIMTIVAFSDTRKVATAGLFSISVVLHAASSFFVLAGVRVGEAWSGYGTSHNLPQKYFGVGLVFLIVLLIIKSARSTSKA
jgi:hypothetical protein